MLNNTTIRQNVLDELQYTPTSILEEQEGALKKIFNKLANKDGVLDKGAFLGFCRRCQISPQLISRAEIMEIYKATHYDETQKMCLAMSSVETNSQGAENNYLSQSITTTTFIKSKTNNIYGGLGSLETKVYNYDINSKVGVKGDCLTFYGWIETLRRSAGILFSGGQWEGKYPTETDKIRLLLFWIEQGESTKKEDARVAANRRIPKTMTVNKNKRRSSLFQGNNKLLMRRTTGVEPNDALERAEAATHAFGVHDVRFSVAAFDVGGISTRFPQLLPHVDRLDAELKRLFVWYAGSPAELPAGNDGDDFKMSSARFYKFVRECRILSSTITRGIVDVVFKKVTSAMHKSIKQRCFKNNGNIRWKSNSFTKEPDHKRKSMVNRRMNYDDFYIALADLATRKYASSLNFSDHRGNIVGAAFYKLLLHDVLPMFARFWEKTSDSGTAIVVGSPQREKLLQQVAQYAGGSPEKRQGSWRRRWVEVHQLEDELRRDSVVRAFHLQNEETMQLLKAPVIKPFNSKKKLSKRSGVALKQTNRKMITKLDVNANSSPTYHNEIKVEEGVEQSLLASTHRLISRKLSSTSLAGVYLTQDNVRIMSPPPPPPPPPSSLFTSTTHQQQNQFLDNPSSNILMQSVASTIALESGKDQELQNILNVVQSKIKSLEQTVGVRVSKDNDNKIDSNNTSTLRTDSVLTDDSNADFEDAKPMAISSAEMDTVIRTIIECGMPIANRTSNIKNVISNAEHTIVNNEESEIKKHSSNDIASPSKSRNIKSSKKKYITPMRIGDLSTDSIGILNNKSPVTHISPKAQSSRLVNKRISKKANGDVVLYETQLLNSKLLILQGKNYTRDGIRLPRREKPTEYIGTLDVRLQCNWKSSNLESYRIIITSEEGDLFHFRHYTNKEMFEGIRQRHGFQVDFNKYPEVLANVLDEASNTGNKDIKVLFAARRDGTAFFTVTKCLYNGAKTINVLSLNFTQSSDRQRQQDRERLNDSKSRKKNGNSEVKKLDRTIVNNNGSNAGGSTQHGESNKPVAVKARNKNKNRKKRERRLNSKVGGVAVV
jgi:hypothetical protein